LANPTLRAFIRKLGILLTVIVQIGQFIHSVLRHDNADERKKMTIFSAHSSQNTPDAMIFLPPENVHAPLFPTQKKLVTPSFIILAIMFTLSKRF
jgi:hypothetical protein